MSQEFDLIDQFFKPLSCALAGDEIGIGDDGAVLNVPENHQLVVVTDTLVAGVHFPHATAAYDIGWKSLAVNLSDLAAMGATPGFYSLALTLPENNQAWLKEFATGLGDLGAQFNMPLIGGDTTKGPLTITVTAQGWVPRGQAVLRSGAKPGDIIAVTGILGEGGLGLKVALNQLSADLSSQMSSEDAYSALNALNRPTPQLQIASALRGVVSAAIDISDGLLADLGHILEKSSRVQKRRLSAKLILEKLPISRGVQRYLQSEKDWSIALSAGDDYQLCLTITPENWSLLIAKAERLGVSITEIGRIVEVDHDSGVEQIQLIEKGEAVCLDVYNAGYSHF